MDLNTKILLKINSPSGKSALLDSFGRAGAEWVLVAMVAWYVATDLVDRMPGTRLVFFPLIFLALGCGLGWLINFGIGLSVREPRAYVANPQIKLLFKPLTSWKTFPSDHSMAVWLIFFMACIFGLPSAWALAPMALWVVWGRVFAGVHYPLDILGGAGVAAFVGSLAYFAVNLLRL